MDPVKNPESHFPVARRICGGVRCGSAYRSRVSWGALIFFLCFGYSARSGPESADISQSKPPFIVDGALNLDRVVEHFENLYRSTSSIAEADLVISKPNRTKRLGLKMWTEGEERALIVIERPAREAGTATLKIDDNLWNYFPKINRTIRIPPSMMLSSWMGSDFTNDDLVRDSSFRDDYTYELVGRSEAPEGWLIHFEAKPGIVGLWARLEVVVSEDGELPIEARYFDRRGELARTLYWDRVKVLDGRRVPTRMRLEPEDESGHSTEFIYHDIDFEARLPADTFSLSNLERRR